MTKAKLVSSALFASVMAVTTVATPALAWHPQGAIVKYVQNQTTGSAKSDANNAATAVAAKPGDVLKYTIEVRNDGAADSKGYNDMAKTVLTDTLPAGVELVSNPASRTITENLGTIKPGQKVAKEYLVKVTADKDGLIENKACFTGDSTANDNPQKGCDVADVKVTVPPVEEKPPVVTPPTEETTTPETPAEETPVETPAETPAELPNTGTAAWLGGAMGMSATGYAAFQYTRARRNLKNSLNR